MKHTFILLALLTGAAAGPAAGAPRAEGPPAWPSLQEQLREDHVRPGTALDRLIRRNQDTGMLNRSELSDQLDIPVWLRVYWRKSHPEMVYSSSDPSGGYPWVIDEIHEWMISHQDLQPGVREPDLAPTAVQGGVIGADYRISGDQTSPRSESDIRVNFWNPTEIIASSNSIVAGGCLGEYYSTDRGASWGQTTLPLQAGDLLQADPAVDWTSDGTAWSSAIEVGPTNSTLRLLVYRSKDDGVTWTYDATVSGTQTSADKELMWVDHSNSSPFKNRIYLTWHNGAVEYVSHRTPSGTWTPPLPVSGAETVANALGGDVHTNAEGDVFVFWHSNGNGRVVMAKSTDGGTSFGTPAVIGTTFEPLAVHIPAMNQIPNRGVLVYVSGAAFDTHDTPPIHMAYAAWTDLSGEAGCTTSADNPGSNVSSTCKTRIWFSRSVDGGATWSAPIKVNDPSVLNDQFHPRLTVDEFTGQVGLVYYDTINDAGRLKTDVWFQSSTDDGSTWSAPSRVTSAQTDETTAGTDPYGNQYGDYIGLSAYRGRFFPSWTDRRSGGHEEIWSTLIRTEPVLHLSFDDPANIGLDDSGQGHNGVLGAATVVQGQCGAALNFQPDNNVQEFSVPNAPGLDILGPMTGIAWIRVLGQQSPDNNPSCTEGTIFAKEGANWFQIEKNNDQVVFQNDGSGNPGTVARQTLTTPVTPGTPWTQVAFVRDKDGRTVQFYENGLPVGGPQVISTLAFANPSDLMVGNYGFKDDPGACEFNGDIDELKIYDVALPAASIKREFDDISVCNLIFTPTTPCSADPNCPDPQLRQPKSAARPNGAPAGTSTTAPLSAPGFLRADPPVTRSGVDLRLGHTLPAGARATIFDVSGRVVRELEIAPGATLVHWDGVNANGWRQMPGVYLARVEGREAYGWTRIIIVR